MAYAGASHRRDSQDARIAQEIQDGSYTYEGSKSGLKGIIDATSDVGGWPVLTSTTPETDSDGDGIPDVWEEANGLDPNDDNDGNQLWNDGSGYTALEVYLHSLVDDIVRACQSDGNGINEIYPTYVKASLNTTRDLPLRISRSGHSYYVSGFEGTATAYLYSMTGALLLSTTGTGNLSFTLDTPAILQVITNNGSATRKLMSY